MKNLLFLVLAGFCLQGVTQSPTLVTTNSTEIDADKYKDIKGSPYFFEDWTVGNIITKKGEVYENVTMNFDGYKNQFEVKVKDRMLVLDEKYYTTVQFPPNEAQKDTITFKVNVHPRFQGKFVQVFYEGTQYTFLRYYLIKQGEHSVQNVGRTETFRRFSNNSLYYLVIDGRAMPVRLNKKQLLKILPANKAAESYVKKEKLKLNTVEEVVQLLAFYEQ